MSNKQILKIIADDLSLTTELKDLFGGFFTIDNLDTSKANNELGEQVRARLEGKKLLEAAFKELERYKTPETRKVSENPAR